MCECARTSEPAAVTRVLVAMAFRTGRGRGRPGPYDGGGGTDYNDDATVFVGNLPFEITWQQLKDHFSEIGSCRADVKTQEDGRSRGFGLVKFGSAEEVRDNF